MKTDKEIMYEMEDLISKLKVFKNMYDSSEIKTEQFVLNYTQTTNIIKSKLMELSTELVSWN